MRNLFIIFSILFIASCKNKEQKAAGEKNAGDFSVKEFHAMQNFQAENKIVNLDLDYSYAIDSGFVIPSVQQTASGNFIFSFMLKNNSQNNLIETFEYDFLDCFKKASEIHIVELCFIVLFLIMIKIQTDNYTEIFKLLTDSALLHTDQNLL